MNISKRRIGVFILLSLVPPFACAHDLVLQDAKVINVSPCDRQLRLTVRLDSAGHKHLPGKSATGPYRIDIHSLTRNKKIIDLPVEEHVQGDTLFFVVPSSKLSCDNKIRITVDAGNAVSETNEKNNTAVRALVRPRSTGLVQSCPVDPEKCS